MRFQTDTTTINIFKKGHSDYSDEITPEDYIAQGLHEFSVMGEFTIFYKKGGDINILALEQYATDFTPKEFMTLMFINKALRGRENMLHYNNGSPIQKKDLGNYLKMSKAFMERLYKKLFEFNMISIVKVTDRTQQNGLRKQSTKTYIRISPYLMKASRQKFYDNILLSSDVFKPLGKDGEQKCR